MRLGRADVSGVVIRGPGSVEGTIMEDAPDLELEEEDVEEDEGGGPELVVKVANMIHQ